MVDETVEDLMKRPFDEAGLARITSSIAAA
jgi:hypothetical protein